MAHTWQKPILECDAGVTETHNLPPSLPLYQPLPLHPPFLQFSPPSASQLGFFTYHVDVLALERWRVP